MCSVPQAEVEPDTCLKVNSSMGTGTAGRGSKWGRGEGGKKWGKVEKLGCSTPSTIWPLNNLASATACLVTVLAGGTRTIFRQPSNNHCCIYLNPRRGITPHPFRSTKGKKTVSAWIQVNQHASSAPGQEPELPGLPLLLGNHEVSSHVISVGHGPEVESRIGW